jgi:hypothetical protein
MYATLHFADVHNGDAIDASGHVLPGMERARRFGSPGTPKVREFAHTELAALQDMTGISGATMMADAQDLAFRFPQLWERVCSGEGRMWKARKVAVWTRQLSREEALWVDEQVASYIDSLPFGRFEKLVRAKIIEVDPAAEDARRKAAEAERFVHTGQCNEHGLKTLIAKASAGDVIYFVAMVDRIAMILQANGDTSGAGERQSKAIGILANPARALRMLEDFAEGLTDQRGDTDDTVSGHHDHTDGDGEGEPDPDSIREGDIHPSQNDADDPEPERHPCPTCDGSGIVTGDPTAFVKPRVDPKKLLAPATLFVHVSEESFRDPSTGVARLEGFGPIGVSQVANFLGENCQVAIRKVIDVANQAPVDGYETPRDMREALHQRNPACIFPFGTNLGRKQNSDHTVEYLDPDNGGPPGQTSMGNNGLIGRFQHRVTTHGRWRLKQPEPGVFLWRSPHGWIFLVDHDGTHRLGNSATAQAFWARAPRNDVRAGRRVVAVDVIPADDHVIEYAPIHAA